MLVSVDAPAIKKLAMEYTQNRQRVLMAIDMASGVKPTRGFKADYVLRDMSIWGNADASRKDLSVLVGLEEIPAPAMEALLVRLAYVLVTLGILPADSKKPPKLLAGFKALYELHGAMSIKPQVNFAPNNPIRREKPMRNRESLLRAADMQRRRDILEKERRANDEFLQNRKSKLDREQIKLIVDYVQRMSLYDGAQHLGMYFRWLHRSLNKVSDSMGLEDDFVQEMWNLFDKSSHERLRRYKDQSRPTMPPFIEKLVLSTADARSIVEQITRKDFSRKELDAVNQAFAKRSVFIKDTVSLFLSPTAMETLSVFGEPNLNNELPKKVADDLLNRVFSTKNPLSKSNYFFLYHINKVSSSETLRALTMLHTLPDAIKKKLAPLRSTEVYMKERDARRGNYNRIQEAVTKLEVVRDGLSDRVLDPEFVMNAQKAVFKGQKVKAAPLDIRRDVTIELVGGETLKRGERDKEVVVLNGSDRKENKKNDLNEQGKKKKKVQFSNEVEEAEVGRDTEAEETEGGQE